MLKFARFSIRMLLLALLVGHVRAAEGVDFARDVLPILSDACFHCHGPDATRREAELRLDLQAGLFVTRDGKRIVVPGNSAESELVRRVTSADDSLRMPPPDSNRKLTTAQIETLRTWIDAGAAWSQHWALVEPLRTALPAVHNTTWPHHAIDRFVLARLEREGLQPSPEAQKARLLRRVTLDLIGLPPSMDELDAFLSDERPDAYERVVERLLASPRYGERMA